MLAPVICLITEGRAAVEPEERIAAAARAGVTLVQVREPHLTDAALLALVGRCVQAVRGTRTRVLVNDRLDIALMAGAHGIHLRGTSMPAVRVRAVAPPGFLIGRSVHDEQEAIAVTMAGGLDYLIFGAVFATESKPDRAPAGLDALRRVAGATPLPVLAIGGVTLDRVPEIAAAGAAGLAAIGLFASGPAERIAGVVAEAARRYADPGRA